MHALLCRGAWQLGLITGSPAGLACRANGDGQCSAKMINFEHSPKSQLWIIWFIFCTGDYVPRINNPTKFGWDRISGSISTWRWNMLAACLLFIFCFVNPIAKRTAQNREPISTHDSSKDAVWRKEVPSVSKCFSNFDFWGSFFPKTLQIWPAVRKYQPKWKSRLTRKRLNIGKICLQNMIIYFGSAFQNWSLKIIYVTPSEDITMTSFPVYYLGNGAW